VGVPDFLYATVKKVGVPDFAQISCSDFLQKMMNFWWLRHFSLANVASLGLQYPHESNPIAIGYSPSWSMEHIGSCNPRAVACFFGQPNKTRKN
jgi:hypothetical protein